jgi:hypothetical protein
VAERAAKAMAGEPTRLLAGEVLQHFDVSKGGFNPPIQKPGAHPLHKQVAKNPNRALYVVQEERDASPFLQAIAAVGVDEADEADEAVGFAALHEQIAAYRRELEVARLQQLQGRLADALAGYAALRPRPPIAKKAATKAASPAVKKAAKQRRRSK